jgi:hypothetical protein
MKRIYSLLMISVLGMAIIVMVTSSMADAGKFNNQSLEKKAALAQLSPRVSVQAEGRGKPYISLSDGHDLLTQYAGENYLVEALEGNQANPLSLASADFDEDGVADLLTGYQSAEGGIVTLLRGNPDALYPNTAEAQQRRAEGSFTDAPFLSPALSYAAPEGADFLGAGDFDGDSHCDAVIAHRGSHRLYFLSGDGRGGLALSQTIELQGKVTALVAGEINRRDGLNDLVVGIIGEAGAKALVFESPEGASRATAEEFALPAEATSLALGQLDDEYTYDLAIAAGKELLLVHGRDRKLSVSAGRQPGAPAARVERRAFPEPVQAIALGDFTGSQSNEIALLCENGQIKVLVKATNLAAKADARRSAEDELAPSPLQPLESSPEALSVKKTYASKTPLPVENRRKKARPMIGWSETLLLKSDYAPAARLVCARLSSAPLDNLLLVDEATGSVKVIVAGQQAQPSQSSLQALDLNQEMIQASLASEGKATALLPLRLNQDGLTDLVILKTGQVMPTLIQTVPQAIFQVTTAADNGNNGSPTPNSLRAAIINANNSPGTDSISFNIAGGGVKTINLLAPLPQITSPVTIDGYTQPGSLMNSPAVGSNAVLTIELNGTTAGTARGLNISAGNCVVRGLIINRFRDSGIGLFNNGSNRIEGNFIGLNAAGTAGLGNNLDGVVIFSNSSNNTVGGTSAAVRNVIAGNDRIGIFVDGNITPGNQIQGNYIGTNAAGTTAIGNQLDGVLVQTISPDSLIGGTAATARNVISGNGRNGLFIFSNQATRTLVQGNYIGTNATGTAALGNASNGIRIENSPANLVGGSTAAARNVISGNNEDGVFIMCSAAAGCNLSTTGNQLQGNFIGTNAAGNTKVGNDANGVHLLNTSHVTVGGSVASTPNVIGGNSGPDNSLIGNGILLRNSQQSLVQNNFVGTDVNATLNLGNSRNGIVIDPNSNNGTVRDVVVAFNGRFGIAQQILSIAIIRPNVRIFSNTLGGLKLFDGVAFQTDITLEINSVAVSGNMLTIAGFIFSANPNESVTLDFYSGQVSGTGTQFSGSVPNAFQPPVALMTNSFGLATFSVNYPIPAASAGHFVNAQASTSSTFVDSNFRQIGAICSFSVTPASPLIPPAGGASSFQIQTPGNCPWRIIPSDSTNLHLLNPDFGMGTTTINYTVSANLTANVRTLIFIVQGQTHTVTQSTASCTFNLNPTTAQVSASGGNGNFNVQVQNSCNWTATSNAPWLTTSSTGSGNGTVNYAFAQNPGSSSRVGVITVGGVTHTVTQAGSTCNFVLNPSAASVGTASGNGSFTVTVQNNCPWTAVSNVAWLTTPSSGNGNGTVNYSFAQNSTTSARVGVITVGNQTHTVTQAAAAAGPFIDNAVKDGKHLIITGSGFVQGARVLRNGDELKALEVTPTRLIGKKAAKGVATSAVIQIRNPDGSLSNQFIYVAPQ